MKEVKYTLKVKKAWLGGSRQNTFKDKPAIIKRLIRMLVVMNLFLVVAHDSSSCSSKATRELRFHI